MRELAILTVTLAALAGCGGEAVIDAVASGGGGSTTTPTTSTTTSGTTTTSTTTGTPGDFSIALVEAFGSADCMPSVPPDPLSFDFTLRFDNNGTATASADVLGARVTSTVGSTSFAVTPGGSGPVSAGSSVEVTYLKTPGSAQGTGGCEYCGAGDLLLTVDLEVDQIPVPVQGPVEGVGCAF